MEVNTRIFPKRAQALKSTVELSNYEHLNVKISLITDL
jgi:hypothetical protein